MISLRGSYNGSSPLTRGKQASRVSDQQSNRLIPAHAGKTPRKRGLSTSRAAHPRSRGENRGFPIPQERGGGSSPLTRGKRRRPHERRGSRGLIPAHAGKTSSSCLAGGLRPAHPRSRGENIFSLMVWPPAPGSSPLTRGKHVAIVEGHLVAGLIPAHAGKTSRG